MPKRKRGEPGLDEKLAQWQKELARALKLAKGFERQRMSKRIRDADPSKKDRIEREIAVLKSIDLHQVGHAHLCSSLLKIKGVAESPKLPSEIRPIPRPTELSEDQRSALHNVTSALCNRKQVKDIVDEAIVGTCMALRVSMPEKKGKAKGKKVDKDDSAAERNQAATEPKSQSKAAETTQTNKDEKHDQNEADSEDSDAEAAELTLLRRKRDTKGDQDLDEEERSGDSEDGEEFQGFSDSEAEERAFSRYDDLIGGSSDDDASDEEEQDGAQDSRVAAIRRVAPDDLSLSSDEDGNDLEDASENEDDDTESASSVSPPPKRAKSTKISAGRPGESAFIPSLMGGYISGSESASDVDVAPPVKKNRRGQRARQAIWEAKYGDKAKHKEKSGGRDQGWDPRRGAVGGDEDGAISGPWKRGITNPFEKRDNGQVHPDRQRHVDGGRSITQRKQASGRDDRPRREEPDRSRSDFAQPEKPKAPTKRDDTGPLHPSWAAAKKSKEQTVAFQGKKVTFD